MKRQEQILGMLWGLHAGDSLGAPHEFLPPSPSWNHHTEIVGGGKFGWFAGEATDDTDLMLCVLKSIHDPKTFSFDRLKAEMLAWYDSNPPDIGTTTIRGLRNLKAGLPLQSCGPVNNEFQGNGSLMRVAPLSLLHEEVVATYEGRAVGFYSNLVETQTKMTHGHQACIDCDRIFVPVLRSALSDPSKKEIFEVALEESKVCSSEIYHRIKEVPHLRWEELRTSGYCVDTLCAALWGFLKYDSFEEAVVAVVNRGDDADSSGAVTGALCGAFYGASAIPQRWLQVLEFKDEIAELVLEKSW